MIMAKYGKHHNKNYHKYHDKLMLANRWTTSPCSTIEFQQREVKTEAEKAAEAQARADKASWAISFAQIRFKIRLQKCFLVSNLFPTYKMEVDW